MVIASNEWMNYNDNQKQSQMIETNVLIMATPSPVTPSMCPVTAVAKSVIGAPNNKLNSITLSNNGSNSNHNTDTSECESLSSDNNVRIVLVCQKDSHPFKTRTIYLAPNVECKVGRSIAKSKAAENNAIFDCKVLSRNHAVIWYSSDGKFYVKDTKSSNGTFINERKILPSEAAELNFGDIVRFGVEVTENINNEIHGCIIAAVKQYLPDGREAISINQNQTSFRGESRVSYDELHRLNLFMQETSQREKLLKSKLHNIQNILDATRKNSVICWQSMIDEDRLLNRIDLLENKLQFLQKNSPADQLKEEILRLQDEKFTYQNSAKEALRKVYQERMEALQKLSKMERDYSNSENECALLRDQIRFTKQNLQEVNSRLLRLETEYNEYKEQIEKSQQNTDVEYNNLNATAADLVIKLKQKETECDEYKKKIGGILLNRAEKLVEEESAKEKYIDENMADTVSTTNSIDSNNTSSSNSTTATLAEGVEVTDAGTNLSTKKSTIMKWLQNSDLSHKEGSVDIMKAICSELNSGDESENDPEDKCVLPASSESSTSFESIRSKIDSAAQNLTRLEDEMFVDIHQQNNKSYLRLKHTDHILRELLKEIPSYKIHLITERCPSSAEFELDDVKNKCVDLEKQVSQQTLSINDYQKQIRRLKIRIKENDITSCIMRDDLRRECEVLKMNISELTNDINKIRDEKEALEKCRATGDRSNSSELVSLCVQTDDISTSPSSSSENSTESFDKIIEEDLIAMNNAQIQHEEELILYKEKFGQTQAENLRLRREVAELKLKTSDFYNAIFKKILTYIVVFIALIVYFIVSFY